MKRWQGVFPAITTKFNENDQLDIDEMERCFAFQLQAGVHGFIIAAALGEGDTLNMIEKTEVMKAALRVAAPKVPVLMTISSASTREACLFAEASALHGADGLLVMPPSSYQSDEQETETHFRAVAHAGGIPVMVCTGHASLHSDIKPEMLAKLADEPLFWGISEASGNVRRITRILHLTGDRYDVFAAHDNLACESLLMGARGWIASLAGAFPRETLAIWRYTMMGHVEEARRIYRWFQPLLDLEASPKHVQNIKLVERMIINSNDHCRIPRQPLHGEERSGVEKIVRYAMASRAGIVLHPPAAE
jgi:dihydrodipicolinate synthase/N-acetylneuraminate lyase